MVHHGQVQLLLQALLHERTRGRAGRAHVGRAPAQHRQAVGEGALDVPCKKDLPLWQVFFYILSAFGIAAVRADYAAACVLDFCAAFYAEGILLQTEISAYPANMLFRLCRWGLQREAALLAEAGLRCSLGTADRTKQVCLLRKGNVKKTVRLPGQLWGRNSISRCFPLLNMPADLFDDNRNGNAQDKIAKESHADW